MSDNEIRLIQRGDDEWPEALDDLKDEDAVSQLWVRGSLKLNEVVHQWPISIVGSRASSAYGESVTSTFVDGFVKGGRPIISGAAFGIDAAAHRAALVGGGSTVAVLACGVDRAYPAAHKALLDNIAEYGLIVSEYEPGTAPAKHRFLERNRIIAALGSAMLVVEAGRRSGSFNAAGWADRYGRPVYAVPGPITSATSVGTHHMIKNRLATLATEIDDVLTL